MAAYSAILPPNSLGEVVRPIADLSNDEFSRLLKAVTGPRTFSLQKDDIEKLRSELPSAAAKNLIFLLSSLSFVYAHLARLVEAGMPYAEAIASTIEELDAEAKWGDKKGVVLARFADLFKPDVHQRLRKVQRLQAGFIPHAVSFSSLVDLRPDFGDGDRLELQAYVPAMQFRVTTDSAIPQEKAFVFQLNETTLADLKKAIERMESKLTLLREKSVAAAQILKVRT